MSAFTYYIFSTRNELIKLKKTFAFWLSIISALIVPLLSLVIGFFKTKMLIPGEGVNPWDDFMMKQITSAIPFLVPMFIVLFTSLILQIEHKSFGMKHLFSLPIPKWSIYFGKLSVVLLSVVGTYAYFFIAILISGGLLGFVHPDLRFLDMQPDYMSNIKLLGTSFMASLGIVGIQFWMSFRFKNFIAPLGVGMTLVVVGLIISRDPDSIYFPYAYNALSIAMGDTVPLLYGFSKISIYSVSCFVIVSVLGYLDIRRLNVS